VFLKIFYNLSNLLIISNLTLQTFNFMTFYTELLLIDSNIRTNVVRKKKYSKYLFCKLNDLLLSVNTYIHLK